MITLSKKLKQGTQKSQGEEPKRISIRDKLLIKEVQEMEENLPKTCKAQFENPNKLHLFTLTILPDEGFWSGGKFKFTIEVPDDYNIVPPKVVSNTRIWHPNIGENGEVCLSLLRQSSYDSMGMIEHIGEQMHAPIMYYNEDVHSEAGTYIKCRYGWAPTRKLKDVIWGLNSLFSDLLNFDDPLNVEAAEHYERDKESFKARVRDYIQLYAKR